jgi:hypothetical protein
MYSTGSGRDNNATAELRLASGESVRVPGIAAAKASALDSWRRQLEARAQASMPTQVPPDDLEEISARYQNLRADLDRRRTAAYTDPTTANAAALARRQQANAELDRDVQTARNRWTSERLGIDQQLESARSAQTQASSANAEAIAVLAAVNGLTFWRYSTFVMFGRT